MANWNGYQLGNIPVWGDTTIIDTISTGMWTVNIANANNFVYFVTSTGEVTRGRRAVGRRQPDHRDRDQDPLREHRSPGGPDHARQDQREGKRGDRRDQHRARLVGVHVLRGRFGHRHDRRPDERHVGHQHDREERDGQRLAGLRPGLHDRGLDVHELRRHGLGQLTALAAAEGKDVSPLGGNINNTFPALDPVSGRCDEAPLTNWGDTLPSAPVRRVLPAHLEPDRSGSPVGRDRAGRAARGRET